MERLRRRLQIVISVSVVASGVLVCAILLWTKPTPPRRADSNRVLDVAVVTVTPTVESTPILGHGTVRAKKQVDIVPQVSGLLVRVHEHLAQGKIIPKGEVLFEIDPTVYASRVRQAKAEVQGLEASLAGHDQEAKNLEARIANAQQMLAIDERDYQTSKNLFEQDKVGTARAVDMLEQKYLRQNGVLVELTSKRSMIPHLKLETAAKLEAARAKLNQTQHDLEHTTILCPFEARVEAVSANQSQVVTAHFSIAKLTDMEAFEIAVGIDPRELRWLDEAIRPQALESADSATAPTVKVRWSMQGQELSWEGRVTRFERVDEATRTARMVVEIRKADMVATVGDGGSASGSTLAIGMFCTTELPAQRLIDAVLVPRHAIYDNRWVYVFEPDADAQDARSGRLGRRRVPILRSVRNAVLVDYQGRDPSAVCELSAGDRVIVSSLAKPVVGMRIRLREDQAVARTSTGRTDPVAALASSSIVVQPLP